MLKYKILEMTRLILPKLWLEINLEKVNIIIAYQFQHSICGRSSTTLSKRSNLAKAPLTVSTPCFRTKLTRNATHNFHNLTSSTPTEAMAQDLPYSCHTIAEPKFWKHFLSKDSQTCLAPFLPCFLSSKMLPNSRELSKTKWMLRPKARKWCISRQFWRSIAPSRKFET